MPAAIEGTYKNRDVEGLLDIYFYRRLGFALARVFARLGLTPTGVTFLSLISGLAAGHLYYYPDLRLNLFGMGLHILSNAFDNADGQLARLTNTGSRAGRILDSISDHIVFLGIYLHLVLRCLAGGASPAIWLLALAAGLSHAVQGGFADYFRNAYLFFVAGPSRAEVDSSIRLRAEYNQLLWRRQPWQKFLLRAYLNFTLGQEKLSPNLMRLRVTARRAFPSTIPQALQTRYRTVARPLFEPIGLLMTNTRMLILFLVLILDHPAWYFIAEVTILNLVLAYALIRQDQICRLFLPEIENLA
ncbi:MAG: CDP-alcohol phosphatidyltransferase family protein [Chthoniobacterales bacterium]